MREILSRRGFTQEEINNLESREDYNTLRWQVEWIGVNEFLNILEEKTEKKGS